MSIVVLKSGKTRQRVGFPGSVGYLLKSVAMNLLLSMVLFFSPTSAGKLGLPGKWDSGRG